MSSFQSRPKECAIKGRQHSRVGEEKGYLYSSLVYSPKSRGNKEKNFRTLKEWCTQGICDELLSQEDWGSRRQWCLSCVKTRSSSGEKQAGCHVCYTQRIFQGQGDQRSCGSDTRQSSQIQSKSHGRFRKFAK